MITQIGQAKLLFDGDLQDYGCKFRRQIWELPPHRRTIIAGTKKKRYFLSLPYATFWINSRQFQPNHSTTQYACVGFSNTPLTHHRQFVHRPPLSNNGSNLAVCFGTKAEEKIQQLHDLTEIAQEIIHLYWSTSFENATIPTLRNHQNKIVARSLKQWHEITKLNPNIATEINWTTKERINNHVTIHQTHYSTLK